MIDSEGAPDAGGSRFMMQTRWRPLVCAASAAVVFLFAWFFRFNDPGGSFAGLTDDHFFYLVRGWQLLFGDLPVRDFVDHGAPLFYYIGAAVQWVDRGTLSELVFCTTVLAAAAAATFLLAARASGSVFLGLVAAGVHILLEPRFYNYPKIVVYAAAIPLLWRFADRQTGWRLFALAAVTVIGGLFRHDHALFVAVGVVTLVAALRGIPWQARVRHLAIYGALVVALASPYIVFVEMSEGVRAYLRDAADWAEKDRSRAPVVWPGLFDNPDGISDAARGGAGIGRAVAAVRDNAIAWTYYLEIALPFVTLGVLMLSRDGFRPRWPNAVPKVTAVAALGLVLNAGFLRSPLAARLADPSVPHAVLLAWLASALLGLWRHREQLRPRLTPYVGPIRAVATAAILPIFIVLAMVTTGGLYRRLDKASLVERPGKPFDRAAGIAEQFRHEWELSTWVHREDRPDLMTLALYLNACTEENDRIFVQPYIPQVLAMSRRAFAGGHADLRPGFFDAVEAQTRTLERLQRQPVPIALFESNAEYRNFRKAFPLIAAYFDQHYHLAATHLFDGRFAIQLFARNDLADRAPYALLAWPCLRPSATAAALTP